MKTNMQQAPIRNANTIGASVYSHSGEFAPAYTDLQLTGRGLDFKFTRTYRSSLADHIGELGRGWSSSIAKKIERKGDHIIYHNGAGEVHKFAREKNGNFTSPTGFYGVLSQEKKQFLIYQRYGLKYRFEAPEQGGRILSIEDRNQNAIQFSYSANTIVIVDSLKRKVVILVNKGLLQELKDHAGRKWKYTYDKNGCLIEVTQPSTADFPNGTTVKYAYDANHRLISVTDAKGQKYLMNYYDESGKVVGQEHGSGVFRMEYNAIGEIENRFPIYRTTCIRKNGSKLVLEHNGVGNVLLKTLHVRKESFAPQDTVDIAGNDVPLITKSAYNKNSELTSRVFPAGNMTEWIYSDNGKNPLDQGNLTQVTEIPADGVESDQSKIVTKYEYEPKFQLMAKIIDPRGNETLYEYDEKGNLIITTYPTVTIQPVNSGIPRPTPLHRIQKEEYHYNSMGQLLRRKHIDGSITEYYYYPVDDPIGRRGLNTATNNPDKVCGYLAHVVRDANGKKIKNEYAYDNFGNQTTALDGKNNPARLRYNAMGRVESVTSREPFKNRIDYKYDANYNEIESAQSFERFEYDETNQTTKVTSSTLREVKEYNALDNVTLRKIVGDDKTITEYFVRDSNEKITRQIQPLGNVTEYVYDERNLLIERKFGVGTKEAFSDRFTYTLNNAVRTYTDGNGKTTAHHYDGFHRYKGYTNPVGTKKTQWLDEASNVVRVEIDGDNGLTTKGVEENHCGSVPLMEAKYYFDQWNRAFRVDKTWHNQSNGQQLGESKWNGEKGIISTVLEYAENGLPDKVWTETDNVVAAEYDGVGRVIKMKDLTGEEFSFEYDENNNPTLMKYLGPEIEGRRFERVLRRRYDEMDRLVWQQQNDEAPERFAYNALGNVIKYIGKSGVEILHADDSLGRRVGHAFTITDASDDTKVQKIVRRFEYDDNYRLSAYTDATGNRTMYRYDTLDRQTGIIFPDGNAANVEYDANGNIVRVVDQNDNEINKSYDASNRLVERRSHIKKTDKTIVEHYDYDGLNRMVTAIAPDAGIRRTYDSLSRLLTEQQGNHEIRCVYDSAGNCTNLVYPGGEEVRKTYDIRNRVTSVTNGVGETIASFIYRANDQIARMMLGSMIESDFSYNQQERLESIEYRRIDNHSLVEGFRYQYDDTGKMTHEIQLSAGSTYGERYYYDDANRPIKAQYGVQNVFDPNSSFEQETSYEHFPEGLWKRRIDIDGQGHIIDEKIGTTNQLNNYQNFGSLSFAYDDNGNCIRKGKSNPGYCDYTYDQENRLIKSECYDAEGNKTQTIEYFYDTFGRQVRKVVTDKSGNVTEFTYVWAGNKLIKEYENGVLVRTYFYSIDSTPAQLTESKDGRSDYSYILNGRGLASGLLPKDDPNSFTEKYGYEITGASFMKEINGIPVTISSRSSTFSSLFNSVLSRNSLGFSFRDWQNGTLFGSGGRHTDTTSSAVLNSSFATFGNSRMDAMGAFEKQYNDFLNVLGIGSGGKGQLGAGGGGTQGGLPPGAKNPRDMSLYSQQAGSIHEPTPHEKAVQLENKAKAQFTESLGVLGVSAKAGGFFGLVGATVAVVAKAYKDIHQDLQDAAKLQKEQTEANAKAAADKAAADKAAADKAAADKAEADKAEADKKAAEEAAENKKTCGMVDPDYYYGGGTIYFPSPQQLEAKLMQNRTPMNPNGGPGSPVDISSPPPKKGPGDIDPTVAYFVDGEDGKLGIGEIHRKPLFYGGYGDPMRPEDAPPQPTTQEIVPDNARPWP